MVIFGTLSAVLFDANLIIQIVLLIWLTFGALSKRERKRHGTIMAIGTISNLVTVLFIMGPSLISHLPALVGLGGIITVAHAILGSVAVIGGLLFSLRFVLQLRAKQPLACGKRWMMRTEITLWLVTLVLGIGFYAFYYLPH